MKEISTKMEQRKSVLSMCHRSLSDCFRQNGLLFSFTTVSFSSGEEIRSNNNIQAGNIVSQSCALNKYFFWNAFCTATSVTFVLNEGQ